MSKILRCSFSARAGFFFLNGERWHYPWTRSVRLYVQGSAELPQAFSHPSKAHAGTTGCGKLQLFFGRYAFSLVLNFNAHAVIFLPHAYRSEHRTRMTMDISEALLNHEKDRDFRLVREPLKLIRNIHSNLDFAALGKGLDIPSKG